MERSPVSKPGDLGSSNLPGRAVQFYYTSDAMGKTVGSTGENQVHFARCSVFDVPEFNPALGVASALVSRSKMPA